MRLKPTSRIDDVAALAQVSNATVSRVLNGSASVDPRLRDRVQYAVARLRYRPHRIAESTAASRDMLVMLCNADGDPAREWRYGDALVEERVAGVIIASADPTGETVHALVERGVPVVVVDRQSGRTPVDTVFVDNRAGQCGSRTSGGLRGRTACAWTAIAGSYWSASMRSEARST